MKPLKILIVDDQPINLKLLRAQLEAEGHSVLEATNGKEGLAVLEGQEVDVIVSDILMPVMDGYRLCYEVRRHERFRELPFIIYTSSYVSPADEKLSLDLGADRYLRKPASVADLMRAIEEALSSPRRQPTTAMEATDVLKEYSEQLVTKLEKKNSELERAVSQLTLQSTALETTADAAVITDVDGVILWVNAAFTVTTGYSAEEAIGKTPRILKSDLHSEEFFRQFWKTILDGRPWRSEFTNRHKDGTIYYATHTVTPVRAADGSITHFVGVMHDVTERKRTERRLGESERRFRGTLDNLDLISMMLDRDGLITYCNDYFLRLTGWQSQDVIGASWFERFIPPEQIDQLRETFSALLANSPEVWHQTHELLTRSGERRIVQWNNSLSTSASGDVIGTASIGEDITERTRAEERLVLETQFNQSLIESSPAFFVAMAVDGRVMMMNETLLAALGYSREEVNDADYISTFVVDEEQKSARAGLRTLSESMEPITFERRLRAHDGRILLAEWHGRPVLSSAGETAFIFLVGTDIGERRNSELAIRRQNEYLASLHETAVGLMNRLDLSELLQGIANRCAAITETQHVFVGIVDENDSDRWKPASGTGVFATMKPDMHRGEGLVGQVWARGQTMSVSDIATWPDRKRDLPVELHASLAVPMRSGKTVTGVIGIAYLEPGRQFSPEQIEIVERFAQLASVALDNATLYGEARREIRERKRAEDEIRELNLQLEDRVEERTRQLANVNDELELRTNELSAASSTKDEFLANMSHELRTPLNAILGMSEVLEEGIHGALNDRQRKSLKTIDESGRHLLELINDILDLSKIEAGKLDLSIAPVGVRALCEASVRMVRELAVKKRIRLSTTIDPAMVTLSADDRRLKQILVNLLSNAVKFTPEGGAVGLDVAGSAEQNTVSFSVWDTGIGISAAGIDQLFQPFVQLDSTYSRQFAGTGLGLSLVRRMTQLHGGRVDVESAVGQGSRFTVTVPWRHPIETVQAPAPSEPTPSLVPESDLVALIIEDDAATAEQITRYLRGIGFAVVIHDGGAQATSLAANHNPAVIILDIVLEEESGWSILGDLKAAPETRHIPVIVASVVDDEPRGRALGAADYVVKPVSYDQLAAAVGRVVPSVRSREDTRREPRKSGVILLAEDNASNIAVMHDFIESRGYAMVVASDGFEAVERALECHPAMIFMDIQMPRLDGLEAIRRIRKHAALEKTPIVALTAFAMEGDREKCLAAGADDYMTKPVSLKTLSEVLQRFLESTVVA